MGNNAFYSRPSQSPDIPERCPYLGGIKGNNLPCRPVDDIRNC